MRAPTPTARFRTTLGQAEGKKATGIIVPPEIIDELEAGARPPVRVTVNGHTYRTTIGVMGGRSMISGHILAAKTPETRRRRIDKAVALFLEGKKR